MSKSAMSSPGAAGMPRTLHHILYRAERRRQGQDGEGSCQGQHLAAVEVLLAMGAEVDAVDEQGNTPLFRAVFNYRGDPATLQALIAAGADVRRENAHGVSPL